MADGLTLHTCRDSGRTLSIRKVSFMLYNDLRRMYTKQHPAPEPPWEEVDYGNEKVREPNKAHPLYGVRLAEWESARGAWVEEMARKLYIAQGVEVEIDQEAVSRLRADAHAVGMELDGDDKFVYVAYICCPTADDYSELIDAITQRSLPTEAAVKVAADTFPSPVQG